MRGWIPFLLAALLAACSSPVRKAIEVVPAELVLERGEEAVLEARLRGLSGAVRWRAERGTILGSGLRVTYRAPDFPVDDRVVVESVEDPAIRAEVPVIVRDRGLLGNRIRIVSDAALVFTEVGEERLFEVEVYDAFGRPVRDPEVTFTSDAPDRFEVVRVGPTKARVRARSDTLGTVRIRARYGEAETWGHALFAELQPNARRIEGTLVLEGEWDPDRRAWTRVVLARTLETEALAPGDVFFTGDRTGVWARVEAVRLEPDRVVLTTGKARLADIFRRLRYRAETPKVAVQSVLFSDGRAALRIQSGGDERLVPLGTCETDLVGAEIVEPYFGEVREFYIEAYVELEFGFDPLDRAGFVIHGAYGLIADTGRIEIESPRGLLTCTLWEGEISLPVVSIVVASVNVDLYGEAYVYADLQLDETRFLLQGPRARAVARAAVGFRYDDDRGWRFVDEFGFDTGLELPRFELNLRGALDAEVGPGGFAELGVSIRALGVNLLSGRFFELVGELPMFLRLPVWEVDRADYPGLDWGLGYRLVGVLKLELGGELSELITDLFGSGATRLGRAELFREEDRQAFLAPDRVWIRVGTPVVDLGQDGAEAVFILDDDGGRSGWVEAWIRGGVCSSTRDCFGEDVRLVRVARGRDPGDGEVRLVWRPNVSQIGWYEVQGRHWVGFFEDVAPYASRAMQAVIVKAPAFADLPDGLTLVGKFDREATGVLSYVNRRVSGLGANGVSVAFTSPLEVRLEGSDGLVIEDAVSTLPPGQTAYHRVSYVCPGSVGTFSGTIRVTTNDPDDASATLPVTIECTPNNPPVATILKSSPNPARGTAPLELRVIAEGSDPDGDPVGCYLNFGDGSPRVERPLGSPDCASLDVTHTYETPGNYVLTFVVTDSDGDRDADQITVEVLE